MNPIKRLVRNFIRSTAAHTPAKLRDIILDGCLDRIGPVDIGKRLLRRYKIVEIGADGDRGIVTGAWNDQFVIQEYASTGTFSTSITRELIDFFGSGAGTYMDIGANIGLTTIPIARNPLVRCLAFEPEPLNFSLLKRNVMRNAESGSVEFHQVALFDKHGSMSLTISEENLGDHRLTRQVASDRRMIQIAAVPLDDFLDKVIGRLAIKVDTQGAEPFIIAGGKSVFARTSLLAMEFCPYLMRQLGGDPDVVIDLVTSFDRIAVMPGGRTEVPHFLRPAEARSILQHKVHTAAATDSDHLDILAHRVTTP